MISLQHIKQFYPEAIANDAQFQKHMLKEYVQLLILDFLATTPHIRHLIFIGGTNLRLAKGIDRFSEDLDFDCKAFSAEAFQAMANDVVTFLTRSGFKAVVREKESSKRTAFSRSIYFPEFLYELGLSGHKDERFMVKLEAQDQGIDYSKKMVLIKGCGLVFQFPVPTDAVLCSMKIAALLNRGKGRDFYDVLFLLAQTKPDYDFLTQRCGVRNFKALKDAIDKALSSIDLAQKKRDFEHLLFNRSNSERILHFPAFIHALKG
ncbi:MAG: nucleotidyl transferase AbiEii/AbiGii toxin family protein [bacterium]